MLNQYQRRADLIPNIVATVKGEANFEQETLTRVIEALPMEPPCRVTPETLNNPEAFAKFQQAQGELSSALSRLMVVSERYPTLQANQGFRDLRVQLEGTENRITVARNRYIQAVQQYSVLARSFPTNLTAMIFNYDPKPTSRCRTKRRSPCRRRWTSASPRKRGALGLRDPAARRAGRQRAARSGHQGAGQRRALTCPGVEALPSSCWRCWPSGWRPPRASCPSPSSRASSTRPARWTTSSARRSTTSSPPSSRRRARRSWC